MSDKTPLSRRTAMMLLGGASIALSIARGPCGRRHDVR
jgi:hypothetical protein